tara:strand:+ start:247 stop:687 length:441 start_codon:yes stop_codon:yes gene_type:complete
MNINSLSKDYLWTGDGDLFFDPNGNGDLYTATSEGDEVLSSAVIKRLTSSTGDWGTSPELGADLIDFIGLPNTRETAALIQTRVENILVQDLMIRSDAIGTEVFPIGPNELLVMMMIDSIDSSEPIITAFSFDMRDNKMIPRIINV